MLTEEKVAHSIHWYSEHLKFYYKRDDFNFPIVNFPFVCSNILVAPVYEAYSS